MVATLEDYLNAGTSNEGHNRTRLPGWPKGKGDGGRRYQPPEIELATLKPIDRRPPHTVITHVRAEAGRLVVRGATSDGGTFKSVTVNSQPARSRERNFAQWEIVLPASAAGAELVAEAADEHGNVERTPHRVPVSAGRH